MKSMDSAGDAVVLEGWLPIKYEALGSSPEPHKTRHAVRCVPAILALEGEGGTHLDT